MRCMPSGRAASKKFVTISCAAWAEDQLAARLFGPAEDGTIPLVEEARGGTLCLEDIESLSQSLQARLLTLINEQGMPARNPHHRDLQRARARHDAGTDRCARICSIAWAR